MPAKSEPPGNIDVPKPPNVKSAVYENTTPVTPIAGTGKSFEVTAAPNLSYKVARTLIEVEPGLAIAAEASSFVWALVLLAVAVTLIGAFQPCAAVLPCSLACHE